MLITVGDPPNTEGLESARFEDIAVSRAVNLSDRSELALATLGSLGLVDDIGASRDYCDKNMLDLQGRLKTDSSTRGVSTKYSGSDIQIPSDKLPLEVFLPPKPTPQLTLRTLVEGFDQKQYGEDSRGAILKTRIADNLWDLYLSRLTTDPLFGSRIGAQAMLLGENVNKELGLYSQDDEKEARSLDKPIYGAKPKVMNPIEYLMLNAQRREQGLSMLDPETFTYFPQVRGFEEKINIFGRGSTNNNRLGWGACAGMRSVGGRRAGVRFVI